MLNNQTSRTNIMVKAALLTALSVILTRFFSVMILPTVRVGFGSIPLGMAGIMFGPVVGGVVGFVSDIIGVLILPQGAFHPGFTLSSILQGVIPGLIFLMIRKTAGTKDLITFKRIFATEVIVQLIIGVFLNTIWLSGLYGKGFFVLLPNRLINITLALAVNTVISYNLLKQLYRYQIA